MSIQRINTILLHTWYHFLHSMETWVDIFWSSAINMVVFVFIAHAFSSQGNSAPALRMITGMIFWNIIWNGQYVMTVGPLWEIWSRSLSSLFITPLTLEEFLTGQMISSIIKSIVAVVMASTIAWWLFQFSIASLGWILPIYLAELLVFAWGIGMLVLSLIFRFGTDVQSLSWALVYLVQPLGGLFYTVAVLPVSVRWITYAVPSTYVMEAVSTQFRQGIIDWRLLGIAAILSLVYLVLGYIVLARTFASAKASGAFARMES